MRTKKTLMLRKIERILEKETDVEIRKRAMQLRWMAKRGDREALDSINTFYTRTVGRS